MPRLPVVSGRAAVRAAVYCSLGKSYILTEEDQLQGDPVLSGFPCPVKDLF